ncbi:hypothetical protein TIFTF001_024034 [Ficus carica]|uniref:Uncharacterized protein n=1 Tax=Ficus carica TaxID=3494 RepID=A0AA88AMN5_FICCA|nr:hypothetical protein TIFTF001_024034 [Ficus carica]
MQSISAPPLPNCCNPIPNHFHFHHPHLKKKLTTTTILRSFPNRNQSHYSTSPSAITLSQAHSCSKQQDRFNNRSSESDPYHSHPVLLQFFSSTGNNSSDRQNPEAQSGEKEEEQGDGDTKNDKGLFTNMCWADLKAALGQRFNSGAIVCFVGVVFKDRHLALPHVAVPDITYIDWAELRRRGFKGVVFDKDNTLTAPYSLKLWGPLAPSLEQCKSVFGPNIAVFSNSAGLFEYDHDGSKARVLEGTIGIKVIRHRVKKPAGSAEEIENHFGCESSELIMVGDRPLTDIVYGNMNGFLTVLTEPLSLAEEPFIVRQCASVGEKTRNSPGQTLVRERVEAKKSQAIARRQAVCDRSTKCIEVP